MAFIIRANPLPGTNEAPTYWLPGGSGYTRTPDINKAVGRGFATRDQARAYMASQRVAESDQTEIIEA
jgi:hypothetical protein